MSMPAKNTVQASTRLNAAGMLPNETMALAQRQPAADEEPIVEAVEKLYINSSAWDSAEAQALFSPQAVFTLASGSVAVGLKGVRGKLNAAKAPTYRLLVSPKALPEKTLCIDQVQTAATNAEVHTLIVVKRRAIDGLVVSMTEERNHARPSAASVSSSRAPMTANLPATARPLNYYSPTDNMLSPCTSKLHLAKKKHHLKGTPRTLFASQLANKQPSSATNTGLLSDMDMD